MQLDHSELQLLVLDEELLVFEVGLLDTGLCEDVADGLSGVDGLVQLLVGGGELVGDGE